MIFFLSYTASCVSSIAASNIVGLFLKVLSRDQSFWNCKIGKKYPLLIDIDIRIQDCLNEKSISRSSEALN